MPEKNSNIPVQHTGSKTNTRHHVQLHSINEAKKLFKTAKARLMNVSDWAEISKGPSADFQLTDRNGHKVSRPVQEGDHFRISIPAPGSDTGEGYDWVQVENILHENRWRKDYESVSIRVRPAPNPLKPDKDTAHFFNDDATSTFMVIREGTTVRAEVHGRNEAPNTRTGNLWDKIRNLGVGLGAILGFSKPQWKGLVKGLLDDEDL